VPKNARLQEIADEAGWESDPEERQKLCAKGEYGLEGQANKLKSHKHSRRLSKAARVKKCSPSSDSESYVSGEWQGTI
jgi:hypothetical protein